MSNRSKSRLVRDKCLTLIRTCSCWKQKVLNLDEWLFDWLSTGEYMTEPFKEWQTSTLQKNDWLMHNFAYCCCWPDVGWVWWVKLLLLECLADACVDIVHFWSIAPHNFASNMLFYYCCWCSEAGFSMIIFCPDPTGKLLMYTGTQRWMGS